MSFSDVTKVLFKTRAGKKARITCLIRAMCAQSLNGTLNLYSFRALKRDLLTLFEDVDMINASIDSLCDEADILADNSERLDDIDKEIAFKADIHNRLSAIGKKITPVEIDQMFNYGALGLNEEQEPVNQCDKEKTRTLQDSIEYKHGACRVSLPWHENKIDMVPSNHAITLSVHKLEQNDNLNDNISDSLPEINENYTVDNINSSRSHDAILEDSPSQISNTNEIDSVTKCDLCIEPFEEAVVTLIETQTLRHSNQWLTDNSKNDNGSGDFTPTINEHNAVNYVNSNYDNVSGAFPPKIDKPNTVNDVCINSDNNISGDFPPKPYENDAVSDYNNSKDHNISDFPSKIKENNTVDDVTNFSNNDIFSEVFPSEFNKGNTVNNVNSDVNDDNISDFLPKIEENNTVDDVTNFSNNDIFSGVFPSELNEGNTINNVASDCNNNILGFPPKTNADCSIDNIDCDSNSANTSEDLPSEINEDNSVSDFNNSFSNDFVVEDFPSETLNEVTIEPSTKCKLIIESIKQENRDSNNNTDNNNINCNSNSGSRDNYYMENIHDNDASISNDLSFDWDQKFNIRFLCFYSTLFEKIFRLENTQVVRQLLFLKVGNSNWLSGNSGALQNYSY